MPTNRSADFLLSEQDIAALKSGRRETQFGGCFMCHGLFIKADQTLGCSCQVGYTANLGDIVSIDVGAHLHGPLLRYIRESFKEGYEPFPRCGTCYSKNTKYPEIDLDHGVLLHVEPSNSCNLWCEVCLCTDERKSANPPPRVNLSFAAFEKMVADIHGKGIPINTLALVGYGEPLFNSDTPRMARLVRKLYPNSCIFLDTNANFGARRAKEIADCGFSNIRLALDGVDQKSYQDYRQGGDFAKAIAFTRQLVAEIQASGSATKVIWKYILFRHNDSDDQLHQAILMAAEIGIEIQFDYTVGILASRRTKEELEGAIGNARTGANLDMNAQKAVTEFIESAAEQGALAGTEG